MNARLVAFFLVFLVAGIGVGYGINRPQITLLQSEVATLRTDYDDLNTTHTGMVTDYENLNSTYNVLQIEYDKLNATYNELKTELDNLEVSYDMLYKTHVQVQANYNLLVHTFDSPLHDKDIPQISDLESWLQEDKTDEIQYDYLILSAQSLLVRWQFALEQKTMTWEWFLYKDTSTTHVNLSIIC